jgi:hypothetical protein
MEIELAALVPGMAGEHPGAADGDMVGQFLAAFAEDVLEHVAQGKHGGAGIDGHAIDRDLPRLAAGVRGLFHHGDGQARAASSAAAARPPIPAPMIATRAVMRVPFVERGILPEWN